MSLFDNAIHSIQTSLNYYWRNDRLVSSVRNLYAGILLLFKHKLSTLSTPGANAALIKKKCNTSLNESGVLIWKGVGSKTIDVAGIKSRFQSLWTLRKSPGSGLPSLAAFLHGLGRIQPFPP
ncbi:TPA: hypothetical protein SMS57_003755 [Pseudomonas aeruginosa]|nr:hypothetical protein [Pseudomonas aeruginosa]